MSDKISGRSSSNASALLESTPLDRTASVHIEEPWKGTELTVAKETKATLRIGLLCTSESNLDELMAENEPFEGKVWRLVENDIEHLVFGIYPGSGKVPRPLDIVFYALRSEDEEADVESELDSFRLFSDKLGYIIHKIVFARRESPEALAFALEVGGTFKAGNLDIAELSNEAAQLNNALIERITTVFKAFDRDNSGYLDIKEIEQVSAELGHSVSSEEMERLFSEVDENQDGRISLEEFTNWYKSGRLGSGKLLRTLTSKIAGAKGLLKNAGKELNAILGSESTEDEHLNVNIKAHNGSYENKGLQADIKLVSGKLDELEALAAEASVPEDHTLLILSIKTSTSTDNPEDLASREFAKLISLASSFDPILDQTLQSSRLTIRPKGDRLYILLSVDLSDLRPFASFLKDLSSLVDVCKFQQQVHVQGVWDISMEDLFEDERNILESFTEDFHLDVKLDLWRRYRELVFSSKRLGRELQFLRYVDVISGDIDFSVEGLASLPEFIFRKVRSSRESMKAIKTAVLKKLTKTLASVLKTLDVFSEIFEADFEIFARVSSISGFLKVKAPGLSHLIS